MIFTSIIVGVVLVSDAILVLGALVLALGKSNVLILVEIALATVDAASTVISANIFLPIDGEGIQVIVVILLG